MSVFTYPPVSASPIKSIQRGTAASAGSITISSVNTSKTFVRSFSTGSAGSAGATGTDAGTLSPSGGNIASKVSSSVTGLQGSWASYVGTRTFTAGTTNLTTATYGVYLTNSTTLTATGACEWEVVEYN